MSRTRLTVAVVTTTNRDTIARRSTLCDAGNYPLATSVLHLRENDGPQKRIGANCDATRLPDYREITARIIF